GAKRIDRVKESIKSGNIFCLIWGLVMFIILSLFAEHVARLFSKNPDVIKVIVMFLRIVPIAYGFQSILTISTAALNVLNRAVVSSFIILGQMLIFYIPLALLGSHLFHLPGVFYALTAVYFIGGLFSWFYLNIHLKHNFNFQETQN
ncbi:MAG: MATE family efflux transporter, partial [bacterium]|nr:MATE family efflux transporter [bacterium]